MFKVLSTSNIFKESNTEINLIIDHDVPNQQNFRNIFIAFCVSNTMLLLNI